MARVVVGSLRAKRKPGPRASVSEKRVKTDSGEVVKLRTINAGSQAFGDDLKYVFERNVAKARRENRKVTGANDSVVKR